MGRLRCWPLPGSRAAGGLRGGRPGPGAEAKAPGSAGSTGGEQPQPGGEVGLSRAGQRSWGVQTHPSRFTPFRAAGAGKSRRTGLGCRVSGPWPAGATPGLSCSVPKSLSPHPSARPSEAKCPTGRAAPGTQLVTSTARPASSWGRRSEDTRPHAQGSPGRIRPHLPLKTQEPGGGREEPRPLPVHGPEPRDGLA